MDAIGKVVGEKCCDILGGSVGYRAANAFRVEGRTTTVTLADARAGKDPMDITNAALAVLSSAPNSSSCNTAERR